MSGFNCCIRLFDAVLTNIRESKKDVQLGVHVLFREDCSKTTFFINFTKVNRFHL